MAARSAAAPDPGVSPPFVPVSLQKFAVLELCTFGLYGLFWFYRNWQLVQRREQTQILPFWRACFALILCYAFFEWVRDYPTSTEGSTLPAGGLVVGFIVMPLTWRLPDPLGLISILSFLFLLPVEAAANRLNAEAAPKHDHNSRLTAGNRLTVVLGGVVL